MASPLQSDTCTALHEISEPVAGPPVSQLSFKPRLWFPTVILGAYWAFTLGSAAYEMHYFFRWISGMAAGVLATLALSTWWFRNKSISRPDRWTGFLVTLCGGIMAVLVCDKSYNWMTLGLYALPVVLTTATLWLWLAKLIAIPRSRVGLAIVVLATWSGFMVVRVDGVSGELKSEMHWRWTPRAEELFLAERRSHAGAVSDSSSRGGTLGPQVTLRSGDWSDFRGPRRDGVVRGTAIATDWEASPPKLIWKRRVGPAWSSVIIVGGRLFTQEQRGESEAVVCQNAETGDEIWAHEDPARFWEAVAGAGPRATPTFDSGRIYAQGATGILNCLDATTGELCWTRNIATESGAKLPIWGFSSSPLVVHGVVIAFAGGPEGQGLLAYHAESGEPAWCVAAGPGSYSSPQLASIGDSSQVLFLSDGGFVAVAPETGAVLWQYGTASPGAPISLQPLALDGSHVLIQSTADFGMAVIEVTGHGNDWEIKKQWATNQLKPSFNDFVVDGRYAFGFDGPIFTCFDLEMQKRRWKQGRYGYGQALLLGDQHLILVVTESGELVLLSANPDRLDELGRFQAIEGKTWNHLAFAHGRLYVRNAEQMACFELSQETPNPTTEEPEVAAGSEVTR
jgi:outer membrane protein assembly factor BamB